MTSEIHPEAEAEFQEATDWYVGQSVSAGEHFVAEMEASFATIMHIRCCSSLPPQTLSLQDLLRI
jgi:hypothetical protein